MVRTFDPAPVDDPAELGIVEARLADLCGRVQREVDAGLLPSAQLAIARDGRLAAVASFGDASTDSRYVIFSCTKPVVASAVWLLVRDGLLDAGARVADVVPEFGTNGKEVVTVEQVLLHTAGFPSAPLGPPAWYSRDARLEAFARWRLNWEPGTRYEYHATSAHWVLAEIVERLAGAPAAEVLTRRVLDPYGLARLRLGVDPADQGDILPLVRTGAPASSAELEAVFGVAMLPESEVTAEALQVFNRPEVRALGVPGAGAVSTAADLALFYQALLHDPLDVWGRDLLATVTGDVRNRMPDFLGVPANRTLGLVVAGDDGMAARRGLGHTVSARAFGHDGAAGQIAFADPATGLSFAFLTNGHDEHQIREWRRSAGIASRAGLCTTAPG